MGLPNAAGEAEAEVENGAGPGGGDDAADELDAGRALSWAVRLAMMDFISASDCWSSSVVCCEAYNVRRSLLSCAWSDLFCSCKSELSASSALTASCADLAASISSCSAAWAVRSSR
jgi:hypothetical protein